ncbi:MAG TPA: pyridoxal-dependent decarboxylase, exosortase A system-associated [Acidiferrobacterales bacterium]|jgi:diaminopimelate decarboxylase
MNKPAPAHAPLDQFAVIDDCLHVGGEPAERLAARAGRTPLYVYDRAVIARTVVALRAALPEEIGLHYAVKANPMPALVQYLTGLVDGLDVASAGEMQVALDAGMAAAHVSIAGPGKTPAELGRAIAAGIVINMESENEMETIARLEADLGLRARVAIRVNPDFELKSSGMKMGGGPKQFGVDAERVPAMLARLAQLKLDFHGFHIFSGSQNLRAAAIQEAQEKTFALALRLADRSPVPVRLLNIGGGFGIPYFPGETPLDLEPIGAKLRRLLPDVRRKLPQAEIVVELGRYLVGSAGVYLCRVIDRKISRGQVFLVTDGGLHHHLAASGNFGQVIRKNYPVAVAGRMHGGEREIASVVGPLCTPLDVLADRMELARAEVGDLIAVFQSGAYGLTASPLGFLSHPPPAELLV